MSQSSTGSGAGRREVAYRLFAREFEDATYTHSESDEERAPNYVITPTGGRVNRLFLVGVLTELERVNEDMLRARIVDPTGAFVVYAGQYQPDSLSFLEEVEPPTFLAVTGKARTFQPEDSDVVYTSVRPESISEVEAETRDRWVVQTAEQTLDRVATMATAKRMGMAGEELRESLIADGVDDGLASGITVALEHYGTTGTYLTAIRETALDAARVVAGDREEITHRSVAPEDGDDTDLEALVEESGVGDPSVERQRSEPASPATAGSTDSAEASTDHPPGEDTSARGAADEELLEAETTEQATGPGGAPGAESAPASGVEGGPGGEPVTDADMDSDQPADEAETGAGETGTATERGDELGDFEPGDFDLDESEREQLEADYGTDFETGNEVDEPGAAGIDTNETESTSDEVVAPDEASATEEDTSREQEAAGAVGESDVPTETAPSDDADLDDAVMETMKELADGEGADREELIATVTEDFGVDRDAVEEAIETALMSGRCYEPDDDTLSPI